MENLIPYIDIVVKLSDKEANCRPPFASLQATAYGQCILKDYQSTYQDMCAKEFMKLKDCYLVSLERECTCIVSLNVFNTGGRFIISFFIAESLANSFALSHLFLETRQEGVAFSTPQFS